MRKQGFSLVELSIVLVILGLLVSGILAGQSLIRAAELRSVSADFTRYKTAIAAFRDKYQALPGDMTNATSFWGAADGNDGIGSDCQRLTTPSSSTNTATCNGNGNGQIGEFINSDGCATFIERFRLWQQLNAAGVLEGNYTGIYDPGNIPGGSYSVPCRMGVAGWNVPRSRIETAQFMIASYASATPSLWGGVTNRIYFGAPADYLPSERKSLEPMYPVLTTQEAWNLDTKMDDGSPFNGNLTAHNTNAYAPGLCAAGLQDAPYDLSRTGPQCALALKLGL